MAQRHRTKLVTEQLVTTETSLVQVQTLLEAGIGCITFLRSLFSDENFEDTSISAPRPNNPGPPPASQKDDQVKGISSVKVKTLKRGISEGADKVIDAIQIGASDAIKRGYLHQLMFAIYLDPDQPTNLVECYCFTFSYQVDSNGDRKAELAVRDQLRGMNLSSSKAKLAKVKISSEDDAKRQVKSLIKALIVSTQLLEELPRRRWMNIRLYYNDSCPDEYEPPLFKAIDLESSRYNITTCDVNEVPDLNTIGQISTGLHGVSLTMCSIASTSQFNGEDESKLSLQQCLELNRSKANDRQVLFDAETLMTTSGKDQDVDDSTSIVPIGIIDLVGNIISTDSVQNDPTLIELAKKVGLKELEPETAEHFADSQISPIKKNGNDSAQLKAALINRFPTSSQDQPTQKAPVISRVKTKVPVPKFHDSEMENLNSKRLESDQVINQVVEALEKVDKGEGKEIVMEDVEMREVESNRGVKHQALNSGFPIVEPEESMVETQLIDYTQVAAKPAMNIQDSFIQLDTQPIQNHQTITRKDSQSMNSKKYNRAVGDSEEEDDLPEESINCDCGGTKDDAGMVICDKCNTWKHVVCYGYTRIEDPRLPESFKCYKCRAIPANTLDFDREAEITRIIENLSSLALFRRVLDTARHFNIFTQKELAEALNIDTATASQMIRKLKTERFLIEVEVVRQNSIGGGKSQVKTPRTQLVFNTSKEQKKIEEMKYFNPGHGNELSYASLLDCSDMDAEGEIESRTITQFRTQASTPHPSRSNSRSIPLTAPSKFPIPRTISNSNHFRSNQSEMQTPLSVNPKNLIVSKPIRSKSIVSEIETASERSVHHSDEEEAEEEIVQDNFGGDRLKTPVKPSEKKAIPIALPITKKIVPNFRKGKGQSTADGFPKASNIKNSSPTKDSMEIDPIESIQENESMPIVRTGSLLTGPSTSSKRRNRESENNSTDSGFGLEGRINGRGEGSKKKKKCSQVGEIEGMDIVDTVD